MNQLKPSKGRRRCNSLFCLIAGVCIAFGAFCSFADQTVTTDYNMSGSGRSITVESGNVDTYTGLFSGGSGGLTLKGGGTAAITNPNNTYSKTWQITLGVLRFDVEGASGTAEFYHAGGSVAGNIKQFQLNAEGAIFSNNFRMTSTSNTGYEYAPLKFMKSCTFAGTVTGGTKTVSIVDDSAEHPTVCFLGDMSMTSSASSSATPYFELIPSGTFRIYGKMSVFDRLMLYATNALGSVELYNPSNSIPNVYLGYTNLKLMEPNVLTNATILLRTISGKAFSGIADLYLYADQHIKGFARSTAWEQSGDAAVVRAAEGVSRILTIDGYADDTAENQCRFAFDGPLTLVKVGDGIQNFYSRDNTMTGAIIVSNGTFKVANTSRFSTASAIEVAGGLLDMSESDSTGCFANARRLTVGNSAELRIGANVTTPFTNLHSVVIGSTGKIESYGDVCMTIETGNLKIGNTTLFKGLYTSTTHPANIGNGITIKCNKEGGLAIIVK